MVRLSLGFASLGKVRLVEALVEALCSPLRPSKELSVFIPRAEHSSPGPWFTLRDQSSPSGAKLQP
jgi:hypothetical protein